VIGRVQGGGGEILCLDRVGRLFSSRFELTSAKGGGGTARVFRCAGGVNDAEKTDLKERKESF